MKGRTVHAGNDPVRGRVCEVFEVAHRVAITYPVGTRLEGDAPSRCERVGRCTTPLMRLRKSGALPILPCPRGHMPADAGSVTTVTDGGA